MRSDDIIADLERQLRDAQQRQPRRFAVPQLRLPQLAFAVGVAAVIAVVVVTGIAGSGAVEQDRSVVSPAGASGRGNLIVVYEAGAPAGSAKQTVKRLRAVKRIGPLKASTKRQAEVEGKWIVARYGYRKDAVMQLSRWLGNDHARGVSAKELRKYGAPPNADAVVLLGTNPYAP